MAHPAHLALAALLVAGAASAKDVDFVGNTTTGSSAYGQSVMFCVKNSGKKDRQVTAKVDYREYQIGLVAAGKIECASIDTSHMSGRGQYKIDLIEK